MDTIETARAVLASRVLALDEEARTVKHVISTGTLDRGNRIVDVAGWHLEKFQANPVVLADHDYSIDRVIGRAVDVRIERGALVSTTQFASEGLGNTAFRLVQAGLVNAWSVGWQGIKVHHIGSDDKCSACKQAGVEFGRHFVEQELLEYSLVAVPANPDAVMGLQRAGLLGRDEVEQWAALTTDPIEENESAELPPAQLSAAARGALVALRCNVLRRAIGR